MGDIDFDELDQAVNSLMGNSPIQRPKASNAPTVPEKAPVISPAESPYTPAPAVRTQVQSAPIPTPSKAQSPMIKSGKGQFMDVIRTSSNMKVGTSAPLPSVSNPAPTQSVVDANPSQNYIKESSEPVVQPQSESKVEPAEQSSFSPFLPNAQVEKRPLGSSMVPTGPAPVPFDEQKNAESPKEAVQPESFDQDTQISLDTASSSDGGDSDNSKSPATLEINSDDKPVVNESIDSQRELNATVFNDKPNPQDVELAKLESHEVEELVGQMRDKPQDELVRTVESGDTEKLKRGRPKKTDNNKNDKSSKKPQGIYDDHQGLSHPTKQKSGWWIVIAIILVIIVFASLGVAAFFILGPGI